MWNFLGDSLMKRLKHDYEDTGNIYAKVISQAENDLMNEEISGHEAAQRILKAIFK